MTNPSRILAALASALILVPMSAAIAADAPAAADTQAAAEAPAYTVKHVTADTEVPFPVKGKVTVVDFGAPWCASCPEMEKRMVEMQKEFGDRAVFMTINVDEWQGIEDVYLIDQMPSQIFYDASGEPIWKHVGEVDADTLRERVEILIAGPTREL